MPDTEIVKLRVRRGDDAQRRKVVLEQGELGYTTDTRRLWVGDGILSGGVVTGNVWRGFVNGDPGNIQDSVDGDLVYSTSNKILYAWNATEWSPITFTSEDSSNSVINSYTINTGPYIAGINSEVIIYCDCTNTNITIYLPSASSNVNRKFLIKKIDASTNTVTIDGNGTETIDRAMTRVLTGTTRPSIHIHSDGTEWWIH